MNKMKLVLGDWSKDGHNQHETIMVETNKTVEEIQQGYKDSCKLTTVSFNHNEDYTGVGRHYSISDDYEIATNYEERQIPDKAKEILEKYNGFDEIYEFYSEEASEDNFTKLWFWFVSLSIPDLVWNKIEDDAPVINGFWNKNLNVQFGYGLYW